MCTAICLRSKNHYFGRTLDLEYSYQEQVTITPRSYPLYFRGSAPLLRHYAYIGMATLAEGIPLYYDGTNEKGLSIAGLNFSGNAKYSPVTDGKTNIAHFELIPWVLASFQSVDEFLSCVCSLNITQETYSDLYPAATLHWMISDDKKSVVVESTCDGLNIYDNPWDVLANNPPFPQITDILYQYTNLNNESSGETGFAHLRPDSRGTGSAGLPGDLTSRSRFARAVFYKHFSIFKDSESAAVSQFFHILGSVQQIQGSVKEGNQYVKTQYTSCCNAKRGIYYYTTYENSQITGISLNDHDLDGEEIVTYPLIRTQQFKMEKRT